MWRWRPCAAGGVPRPTCQAGRVRNGFICQHPFCRAFQRVPGLCAHTPSFLLSPGEGPTRLVWVALTAFSAWFPYRVPLSHAILMPLNLYFSLLSS